MRKLVLDFIFGLLYLSSSRLGPNIFFNFVCQYLHWQTILKKKRNQVRIGYVF